MKGVLVTGATGFLGSHLARALVRAGHRVVATVRPGSSLARISDIQGKLELKEVGAAPPDGLFAGAPLDAVFHLAVNYGRGVPPSEVLAVNTLFPLRLLESALRSSVGLFVAADTGFNMEYKHLREHTLSKRQLSEWGELLSESSGLKFVNLKLQHPYGPGDGPDKFVPMIVRRCREGGEIELTAGEQRKDFIHVSDVIKAYLTLLEGLEKLPPGYSHLGCGSGHAVRVRDFVELIHRLSGSKAVLRFGALPYRENEIMYSQADIQGLVGLGWRPEVTLEAGIRALVEATGGGHPR